MQLPSRCVEQAGAFRFTLKNHSQPFLKTRQMKYNLKRIFFIE